MNSSGFACASEEKKPSEDEEESNKCVQNKELLFGENEGVYIYRHYGKNWYYREKDLKTNKWNNGESLKVEPITTLLRQKRFNI